MKENLRARGRPRDPYGPTVQCWKPGGTDLGLTDDEVADLDSRLSVKNHVKGLAVQWHASYLAHKLRVPVLRRVLEAMLVFDWKFSPLAVTYALKHCDTFRYAGQQLRKYPATLAGRNNDIYCYREPTGREIATLDTLCKRRDTVLDINTLAKAGERYVRGLLVASEAYTAIPQQHRLGRILDEDGKNALDLSATREGVTYGISVKNQREWMHGGSKNINDVLAKSRAQYLRPWLFVSFAAAAAERRCEQDGIKLTVLGRLIVPSLTFDGRKMETEIDRLRAVIGPLPFDYIGDRFGRYHSEYANDLIGQLASGL